MAWHTKFNISGNMLVEKATNNHQNIHTFTYENQFLLKIKQNLCKTLKNLTTFNRNL